jgi:PKD repeat protein
MFRTIDNQASFTMSDSSGCNPLTVQFSSTSTAGVSLAWNFGNGQTDNGINPLKVFQNYSNTIDSIYKIKLVITAVSGCKDSVDKDLIVFPKPKSIFSSVNSNCANSLVTISNTSLYKLGMPIFSWKIITPQPTLAFINDTTLATPNLFFPNNQLAIDTIYTIRLRTTSINNCIHDTSKGITILRRPLANFTIPQVNCGPITIASTNLTTNVGSNWLWRLLPANGTISNNVAQSPTFSLPENLSNDSIIYEVKLIATRIGSTCIDSTNRYVIIFPKPKSNFTLLTQDSCGPRTLNFTNTSIAKNGEALNSLGFIWTFLGANFNTSNAFGTFSNSQVNDSIYNVRLIATSKHGCKDTNNQNVTVWPNAKALFTYAVATSCAPFNITNLNVVAGVYSNANSNYYWYANGVQLGGSSTTFPGYVLPNANDSVLIKLKAISKNGCKDDSMEVWFRTIPNPVPNFSMSDSLGCSPLAINFNNTSTTGVTSSWTFSNGSIYPGGNPFGITFTNGSNTVNASYTVKLVITAGTGCKDSITKSVTVYPKPKAIYGMTSQTCAGSTLIPSNTSIYKTGSVGYGWKVLSPPINTNTQISDTIISTPTFIFPDNQLGTDTVYTIRLRVTSVDGCIHDTTKGITILSRPLAQFTLPQPNCGPITIVVNNNTTNANTWLWTINPIGPTITTSTLQNPQIFFNVNTTNDSINYRLKITATRTTGGCTDTTSRIVTIYPKPQAFFTTVIPDSCGPRMVSFTNTSNAKNGELPSSMGYLWTYLGLNSTNANGSGTFINSQINDSLYAVRLIATSKHGCLDTANSTVTVRPNAKSLYARTIGNSCAPFYISPSIISAQVFSNANISYQWYANNVLLGNGLVFPGYTINNQDDSVRIKLKTISKNGCKNDSMEMWFYTLQNPKPNFIALDSIACSGIQINFQNTSTPTNGLNYNWQFGNYSDVSLLKNPNKVFYNYGTLDTTIQIKLITIAGGTGCLDSITKQIVIKPLPNPNFQISDSVLCFPLKLIVSNLSSQIPVISATSYKWFINPLGSSILNDTTNTQTTISFPDNQSGLNNLYQIKLINQSNFGCIDSIIKLVRVPTRPITSFSFGLDSSCGPILVNTTNVSNYANTFQWSSKKIGPFISNPNNINTGLLFPNHTGLLDSIYPIQLIATNAAGCKDTLVKNYRVFPKPIAQFTTNLDSGCAPLPINFYNHSIVKKPASYNWNYGDASGLNTLLDTTFKTYLGSKWQDTTYIATLITTSINGCKDTTFKILFIEAGAEANIYLSDTIICSSNSNPTKLKIENQSYGSVETFYWDFGDGQTLTTTRDTIIYHAYPDEGTYRILLKAINNCKTSFDTAFVKVQVPPIVGFTKTDSVGCSPLNVVFTNTSLKTYQANISWVFGNGNTSTSFNPPAQTYFQSLTKDTFYYVNLNISNICGAYIKKDTVRVLPIPTALFEMSTDSGCSPLEVKFVNYSYGIPQKVFWNFGNGKDTSGRFDPIPSKIVYTTIDTPTTFIIKLIVANLCGSDTMQKSIKVMPNTVNSFFTTNLQNGCQDLLVQFTDKSTGGQNISYDFGDGSGSNLKNPLHLYDKPGIFRAYQFVNNNCSYDSSSIVITVFPKPNFTIDKISGNFCVNQPVQFTSNILGGGIITWYFGDGDSSKQNNPIHSYATPGKKVYRAVLLSNQNYCQSQIKDSLLVLPIPVFNINVDTNQACLNHSFNFSLNSNGNYFYTWDFGDSNYAIGSDNSYQFKKPGIYNVKVIAKSSNNCIDSAFKQIVVWPIPDAAFDYAPKDTCTGPAWVVFTNLSQGANAYQWNFGNGNTSNATNGNQFYSGIGQYTITLVAVNSYYCYDTSTQYFNIFSKPEPNFTIDKANGCKGTYVIFTNNSKFAKTYLWDFGDGTTSTDENPRHRYDSAGIFNVTLTAFAGIICSETLIKSNLITIHPDPDAGFTHILNDAQKPFRTFKFISNSQGNNTYLWIFGLSLESGGQTAFHTFGEGDSVCKEVCKDVIHKVTSFYGCEAQTTDTVCMEPYCKGLFVPNAFTPEYGNDEVRVFKPAGTELKNYHLKIFNKWGELVWESFELADGQPARGWDGNNMKDGSVCQPGAYIWTIDAVFTDNAGWDGMLYPGSNKKVTKGNVTLIR